MGTAVKADPGIAQVLPPQSGDHGWSMLPAIPEGDPSGKPIGATVERLRSDLPEDAGRRCGG